MSGVAIVWYKLSHSSRVLGVVPANRIAASALPINTALPSISVDEISLNENLFIPMDNMKALIQSNVRVMVLAKTYASLKDVVNVVRSICSSEHGIVNGFEVDSILPNSFGPDLFDGVNNIYRQAVNFRVKFVDTIK